MSKRPMTANPHDHVEIGVLIRAFEGLDLLDMARQDGIVGRSHHLVSDKFRKVVRCRRGCNHGNPYRLVDCALLSVFARPAVRAEPVLVTVR